MANNDIINCKNITVSTINTSTLRLFNLSTTQILLYPDQDILPAIVFSDLSANILSFIAQQNETLSINGTSSILIQAGSNLLLGGAQNAGLVGSTISLNANSNITLFAPESIYLQSTDAGIAINGNNAVVIGNQYDTSLYLTLDNMEGFASTNTTFTAGSNITFNASSITTLNSLSNIVLNTPAQVFVNANLRVDNNVVYAGGVETNTLYTENINTPVPIFGLTYINVLKDFNMSNNNIYNINSISTNTISTGSLFTSSIRANNISSIFNQVSSMRVQTTLTASTIIADTLTGGANSAFYMNGNLYPKSAGSQFGFFGSGGTNSGGFFSQINARSTNTQVITPDIVGAFSNNIRIQGNVSTQNIFVSSINNKQYPYTSTLNTPPSTFSYSASNTQSRTVPYVLYSNVAFPNTGWFNISQKAIFTRASGASDTHQSILYTPGAFISTPSIVDGYDTLPYLNQNNSSTFTTLTTELYISTTQLNRNIILYNDTNNNFVGNLFMDRLVATYNPSRGINPE
jgi:hypothetical protein